MIETAKSVLSRFRRDDRGSVVVEAVVILPLLVWTYTAMFVFFDAYKTENLTVKAAYTVADMISRQTTPVNGPYIDGMNTIFGFLTDGNPQNELRVTAVHMVTGPGGVPELELQWSYTTDASKLPRMCEVTPIEHRIPILALGDQLIVVEAVMGWQPAFNAGLGERTLYELVVAKPRFGSGRVDWNGATVC